MRHRSISNEIAVSYLFRLVTACAAYFFVSPDKLVLRVSVMVKLQCIPVGGGVAGRAFLDRRGGRKLVIVPVGVARRTSLMSDVEHRVHRTVRCRLLCMAGYTRLGEVRTVQSERSLLVAGHSEECRPETVFAVAGNTVTPVGAISKLPAMDIGVTVGTLPVRDRTRHAVVLVALNTLQSGVETNQREVGCTVIEISHGHIVPATCPVAAGAIKSEFALVLVRVAGSAVLEFQIGVPTKGHRYRFPVPLLSLQRVTLGAVDRPMFPRQHKPGTVVIETGDRFKMVVRMTSETISPELPAVLIDMAAQAGSV